MYHCGFGGIFQSWMLFSTWTFKQKKKRKKWPTKLVRTRNLLCFVICVSKWVKDMEYHFNLQWTYVIHLLFHRKSLKIASIFLNSKHIVMCAHLSLHWHYDLMQKVLKSVWKKNNNDKTNQHATKCYCCCSGCQCDDVLMQHTKLYGFVVFMRQIYCSVLKTFHSLVQYSCCNDVIMQSRFVEIETVRIMPNVISHLGFFSLHSFVTQEMYECELYRYF